jgi:hypothetical protein
VKLSPADIASVIYEARRQLALVVGRSESSSYEIDPRWDDADSEVREILVANVKDIMDAGPEEFDTDGEPWEVMSTAIYVALTGDGISEDWPELRHEIPPAQDTTIFDPLLMTPDEVKQFEADKTALRSQPIPLVQRSIPNYPGIDAPKDDE